MHLYNIPPFPKMPLSHVRQTQGYTVHCFLGRRCVTTVRGAWPYFPKVTMMHLCLVIELFIYDVLGPVESYLKEVSFRMVTLHRPRYQWRQIVADWVLQRQKYTKYHEGNYDKQSRQQNN